jgi:NAD(P)-dependent dehydrogenase (short-subunit alcohol dehydrogenase family)
MLQLNSQKIVILGGTSGIGLATAQLAALEGATVVVASAAPSAWTRRSLICPFAPRAMHSMFAARRDTVQKRSGA